MKNDITIIVPVNNATGDFPELFPKAIKSIEEQKIKPEKVIIVHCNCTGITDWLKDWELPEGFLCCMIWVAVVLLRLPTYFLLYLLPKNRIL